MPVDLWFTRHLRQALNSLYDPPALRDNPLAGLISPEGKSDPVAMLRRVLLEDIEKLRPTRETPHDSRAWRVYQILRRRYTEGLSQRQVAADLGLSVRQLQREEKLARAMLADHMWTRHGLEGKAPHDAGEEADDEPESSDDDGVQTLEEELAWLQSSDPVQFTDVDLLIQGVLATVAPLIDMLEVVTVFEPVEAERVPLREAIVRQALLDVVSAALPYAQSGRLQIRVGHSADQLAISVAASGARVDGGQESERSQSLAMAVQLIALCGGALQVDQRKAEGEAGEPTFAAAISLPAPERAAVLVVDDNADALQLLQRYLANSGYMFVGAEDAEQGLALATELQPKAILLDVMMPNRDGWSLLGRLREHPRTEDIPVVVCTILSQRELALALGAAGFIRKPVIRADLLQLLDRLTTKSSHP
ncbi:MAG: response regulator [Chloroflexota bacterium]|nr:response regulator [Chloroflexota bacterium]